MLTFYAELKRSYAVPALILAAGVGVHLADTTTDMTMITRVAILVAPAAVSTSCFLTSRNYGYSRVFGRSCMLLGAGYAATFAGELAYFYHVDHLHLAGYAMLGDALIFSGYPFMMAHIIVNVRYFAERLDTMQKLLLVSIPMSVLAGYCLVLLGTHTDDPAYMYYVPFVSASSILLGLAVVAFSMFRQTVLILAWFVLLVGIAIGTVGDILYNYASTLGAYSFGDFSNVLWISSSLIVIYALYRHKKSI